MDIVAGRERIRYADFLFEIHFYYTTPQHTPAPAIQGIGISRVVYAYVQKNSVHYDAAVV